jgi:hypothetical protein
LLGLALFGAVTLRAHGVGNTALQDSFHKRFAMSQKVGRISSALDGVHTSVYRLVTWSGNYDEAKFTSLSAGLAAKIDETAAIVREAMVLPWLSDEERRHLHAVLDQVATYK